MPYLGGYPRLQDLLLAHVWDDVQEQVNTTVRIRLAQDLPGSAEVELTLTGVQNITLDHLNYGDWLALNIEDISDRGWDRVHFEITALDQSDFKIYCRQVEIKYLQDPSRPG